MAEQVTKQTPSPTVAVPKSASKSPRAASGSPYSPQEELIPANHPGPDDDTDSALGDDNTSSTATVASSILEYRTIQGRTYHSERHNSDYYAPNDERQNESVDITHHYLTLLLSGKLYLAPIKKDIQRALDVGTGTGIWAIDLGDEFPNAEITGTDLSPIQPVWIPPNVRFEIDDATKPWTWPEGTFDFVHMRYLFGAIADWPGLFHQAFRACAPGGWVESGEIDVEFLSDDDTVAPNSALATWGHMCSEAGRKLGRPFTVLKDRLQKKGMEEAGFVDIQEVNFKLPVGGWPQNPRQAETGQFVQLTLENDMEGYSLFLWNTVLEWPKDEYQMFLMSTRRELRSRTIHSYMKVRYVYGRKPE